MAVEGVSSPKDAGGQESRNGDSCGRGMFNTGSVGRMPEEEDGLSSLPTEHRTPEMGI